MDRYTAYRRSMAPDAFNPQRFVDAQDAVWNDVQHELQTGHKTSHWMWFVFPQLADLGRSGTAKFYGIQGRAEACAYLAHPVLGPRLVTCCRLLLEVKEATAKEIFGDIDAMKLRSCMTLFSEVAPQEPVFQEVLERYFAGEGDPLTLHCLQAG
jgi:uncharacterized protein (DUF1810 family)